MDSAAEAVFSMHIYGAEIALPK